MIPLTISGYSTALFATWYFVEELGLLLDAGDGVSAALLQKSRKINHVFISHADRDHLTGLLQLNQLNARPGYPVIYYPRDCSSFPAMEAFSVKFDPHVSGTVWQPLVAPAGIYIKDDVVVKAHRNGHVVAGPDLMKSFGYIVTQVKQKLKPELLHLPGEEIKRLIQEQGREAVSVEVSQPLLGYSGDTPVEDWSRWDGIPVLIHEATFLESEGLIKEKPAAHKHSTLEQVLEMAANIKLEKLVLGHFSSRYPAEVIDRRIKELCAHYGIAIPVYRVLPGVTQYNILNGTPVNR
jgi:ribonuclease Z